MVKNFSAPESGGGPPQFKTWRNAARFFAL
jgi:hypothetical protein